MHLLTPDSIKLHRYVKIMISYLMISSQSRLGLSDLYNFLINLNGFHEIYVKMFLIPKPFFTFQDHFEFKILTDLTHTTPE